MMKVYRALLDELHEHDLKAADILPVAGVDPGTLQKRYADSPARGSVIAKTGTLPRTDGGASALVGQLRTRNGETLLFVIFNQRGSVVRFRAVAGRARRRAPERSAAAPRPSPTRRRRSPCASPTPSSTAPAPPPSTSTSRQRQISRQ